VTLNKDFFERVFKLQPRCMALFGQQAEDIFILLHKARREVEVSSEMLSWKVHNPIGPVPDHNARFWEQCRRDIWDHGDFEPEKDKVGKKLAEFRSKMEGMCRPVIDQRLGMRAGVNFLSSINDWLNGLSPPEIIRNRIAVDALFKRAWRRTKRDRSGSTS
jgi:hypothetical protein